MNDELTQLLGTIRPFASEDVTWPRGIELHLDAYLTSTVPSPDYITSVRAVVLTDAGCAVLKNVDGVHALPGGRRHPAEPIDETLRREILEETGCSISVCRPLGFLHFHHLTPMPTDYSYPYPDFVNALFAVRATPTSEFSGDPDGYETHLEFVPPGEIDWIRIPAYQRPLVSAASLPTSTPPHM
jgi:ADP-ribose pyrophosphatase YjhB (NUDIX family)